MRPWARRARPRALLLLAGLAAACSGPVAITNTGYVGTWQRGNPRVKTTMAIAKVGGEYRIRLGVVSTDRSWKMVCDWEGVCEEFVDQARTSDYRYRIWLDQASGTLRLECKGKVFSRNERVVDNLDEMTIRPDGLRLRLTRLEQNGQTFNPGEGSTRYYDKVADRVDDPPPGAEPSG